MDSSGEAEPQQLGKDKMKLIHELWTDEGQGGFTFCLAGPAGNQARAMLEGKSLKIWECEAECHFEAMTKYYHFQGWGAYTTEQQQDHWPYVDKNGKLAQPTAAAAASHGQ